MVQTLIIKLKVNVFIKFDLTYADEKEQELMAQLFHKRLNLVNPLHCGLDFGIDISKCPKEGDEDWLSFALCDMEVLRNYFPIGIPKLNPGQWRSLLFWILSPYR